MSRIGKLPVSIPAGVTVEVNGQVVTVRMSARAYRTLKKSAK